MADQIYLAEITAYDPGITGTRVLRYCSGVGYVTKPSETPANTLFEPRIVQPCNFTRTAFSDARIMGGTAVGYGEMVLNNADQALCPLMNYGLDGRSCIVRVGAQTAAYPSGFTTFVNGTIEQAEVGATKVTLRLRDNLMLLSIPLQQTLYLGNNNPGSPPSTPMTGAEGTVDDIIGQPKPLAYGQCYHVPCVCVNTGLLIYQVHDGAVAGIDAVYDVGVPLIFAGDVANLAALQSAVFLAGRYMTCNALGLFRLNAIPVRPTAHVRGDNSGGYVSTVAGIVKRILTQRAGIAAAACDASFAALDTSFPAQCGVYVGPGQTGATTAAPQSTLLRPVLASASGIGNTVQAAIDAVLLSGGCWLAPTRINTWSIAQLVAPAGAPVASFTDVDLIAIDSEATADPTAGVPVFSVFLRYKRYAGALASKEAGGSLSAAAAADISTEFRTTNQFDNSVLTLHLLAARLYRDTCLTVVADANAECARVLALHKVRRDFVKATVRLDETKAAIDLGSVVQLVTNRLGYSAGKSFLVVGIASDGRKNELTLDLWG